MLTRLTDILTRDAQARAAAAVAALLLGVLIGLIVLIIAGAPHAVQATPPIIIVDTSPTAAPVAMVAAYDEPGGAQLGDIPADTPIRYRDSRAPGWVGADLEGGVVWFLADGDASSLADLAPQPTQAPPPPVAEQPAPAPQVIYVERPVAPEPAPEQVAPTPAPEVLARPRDTTHERVDLTCVSAHPRPIICTPQGDWHPPMVLPDTHDAQP